jgi:pimeloyl-ACP methyl ester carboxylesterase
MHSEAAAAAVAAGPGLLLEESPRTQPRRLQVDWSPPQGRLETGSLAVRVLGEGAPTLLLHGVLGSNRYWGAAFDSLAADGLLLAPDLLGFGASPRPLSGYGPDEHGGALIASLDEHQVREPILVVGHSLGALLAIWMARKYADRVRGVIAFAPPLFRDPRHARRQIAKAGGLQRLFGLENRAATWMARTVCRNLCEARPKLAARVYSAIRPAFPYPIVEDATRHSWVSYSQTMRRVILAAEAATWFASRGTEEAPILVVAGDQDRYLDLELLGELVDQRPRARLEVWAGAGHDLPLLQPQRCIAAIESFCSSTQGGCHG